MIKLELLRDAHAVWCTAEVQPLPGGAARAAVMPEAALRHLVQVGPGGASARLVRWFDGGPKGSWVELRWPAKRRTGGILARVVLPGWGSLSLSASLEWTMRLAETIGRLAAGPPFLERPILLHVSNPGADPGPEPRRAWAGTSRDAAAIEVDFTRSRPDGAGAAVRANGFVGDLLVAALGGPPGRAACLPLTQSKFTVGRSEELAAIGAALASTALWWSTAGPRDAERLFEWLQEAAPDSIRAYAAAHPASRAEGRCVSEALHFALEARLSGLWQLAALFDSPAVGEEEMAGWVREVEAAFRGSLPASRPAARRGREPGADNPRTGEGRHGAALSPPARTPAGWETEAACDVWVAACDHRPGGVGEKAPLRAPASVPVPSPQEILDGERTLVEAVRAMRATWGLDEEEAWNVVEEWRRRGAIVRLSVRGRDRRTVLYFAFGSCMCLQSFRETVPRFDVVGPARAAGRRLAFTFESVGRSGGVADLVPDPGGEVWGVLYRIPRAYVPRLDAREGVHIGHYQRSWIEVEAFGAVWSPVLTYTVAKKARTEIKPSDEYAGLIMEGAQAFLDPGYCAKLADLFARFGVEPSLPA